MTSVVDGAKAVGTPFTQWAISPNCPDVAAVARLRPIQGEAQQ